MNTSFYNGVIGMKTYQAGLDVWGDNIANANTAAYKQNLVDFHSLFSTQMNVASANPVTSDIGLGSSVSSTVMDLKEGSIKDTDNVFDMAIEGKGWFAVNSGNHISYTKDGAFVRDANGELVNQNGQKILGVDAKTLTFDGKNWKFDSKVDTTNLITSNPTLSTIKVPESIEFPAQATQNISIAGNLDSGALAQNTKPAISSNDFGALYDKNGEELNLKNDQSLVFGFGNLPTTYSNGLIKSDICIPNDIKDGKDVNIDFYVNNQNIKLTLPDGSSKQTIIDAIAKDLDSKNILYDKLDDGIEIKSPNKLVITNNGGDYVGNVASQVLSYKSTTPNTTNGEFTTMNDFTNDLQNLANIVYPDETKVGVDDKGSLYIQNNSENPITSFSMKTPTSNDMFMQNLGRLGNNILANTASSSLAFTQDYQGFSGNIIDANGNKNDLKFDWTKTKVSDNQTTWQGVVSVVDKDGKVLSTTTQDFNFDNNGGLLSPTSMTIDNNGTPATITFGQNFSGLTSYAKDNVGFKYSQDGLLDGYLTGYNVNNDGKIIADFSNGKDGVVAQLPLFHFQNEQGLDMEGGNDFIPTNNSGKAFLYQNQDGTYMSGAKIKNYALETSNVNMSQAMTELIVLQKAFDANSKSVTTSDQMVQKAINMKQ